MSRVEPTHTCMHSPEAHEVNSLVNPIMSEELGPISPTRLWPGWAGEAGMGPRPPPARSSCGCGALWWARPPGFQLPGLLLTSSQLCRVAGGHASGGISTPINASRNLFYSSLEELMLGPTFSKKMGH